MDRDHLEAVIRHELTSLARAADSTGVTTGHLNAVVDHVLDCADEYRRWRKPPDDAAYPKADASAAEHRRQLAEAVYGRRYGVPALDADGQPPYEVRREYLESA